MSTHSIISGLVLSTALSAIVMTGCAVHEPNLAPESPVAVPDGYHGSRAGQRPGQRLGSPSGVRAADRWWTDLGDADLTAMVDAVLASNLSLSRAWQRIDLSRAVARQAGSPLYPTVSGSIGVGGNRSNANLGPPLGVQSNTNASYSLSVAVAYEVDLWGKARNQAKAAELDVQAAEWDLQAAAMTLAATTTDAWLSLLEQQALHTLLGEQDRTNKTYLELVELRFRQGFAGALDVYQQRQQLTATRAQLPLVRSRAQLLQHQLATLAGQAPGSTLPKARGRLPALPALPAVGVPADLLKRRPDVRAAHDRIVAADYRTGVAVADQYPSIQLSASTGFQATDLADLFTSWVWNLAASITQTIFDGGRKSAEVERSKAQLRELVLAYGEAVLTALREVEDALEQERGQAEYIMALDEQLSLAQRTLDEAKARYVNGLNDYLPVLTSLRSLHSAQTTRLSAERQLLSYRVQLHRALGGTWTAKLARPATGRDDDDSKNKDAETSP